MPTTGDRHAGGLPIISVAKTSSRVGIASATPEQIRYYRLAMLSTLLLTAFVSVPGFAQVLEVRPVDLIGGVFWLVAAIAGGAQFRRILLLITIPTFCTLLAAFFIYPEEVVRDQLLLLLRFIFVMGPLVAGLAIPLPKVLASRLIWWIAFCGAASCFSSIVGYRSQDPRTYAHQTYSDGSSALVRRLGGWVGESGAYGAIAIVSAFAILIAFSLGPWRLVGYVGGIGLLVVSYDLSISRVCLIALAVMLGTIFLAERRRLPQWVAATPFWGAAGILFWQLGSPGLSAAATDRLSLSSENVTSSRYEHWTALLQFDGLGALVTGYGYRGSSAVLGINTENVVVGALVDFGIFLGPIFLIILAKLWLWMIAEARSIPNPATGVCVVGLLAAVMLQWMFNDVATDFQAFPLFALLIGAALSLSRGNDPATRTIV
jgi:hypothetical protein